MQHPAPRRERSRADLAAYLTQEIVPALADVPGLPTVWVPHPYAACAQHAPDERLLGSVARSGLGLMAGIFRDLGEAAPGAANLAAHQRIPARMG
jgi:hypothetical protein